MQDALPVQTIASGLAFIPVNRPHGEKKRQKAAGKMRQLQGGFRSASMASLESIKRSLKPSPEASTLPPVPRFPRQATAPALPSLDLAQDLTDLPPEELKPLLSNALRLERELIDSLNSRLKLLATAIKRLEGSASVSMQDISRLTNVFQEISASVANTCAVESELGVKQRELDRTKQELALVRRREHSQRNALMQTAAENRLLKEKVRELQEENAHLVKAHSMEKQKFATFSSKLDALHDGMQALTADATDSPGGVVTKLKGSINALLRELQDGKSEAAHKNKHISALNAEIQRLNKKALRLTYKLNEIRNRKTTVSEHLPQTEDSSQRCMNDPRTLQYRLEDLTTEQRTAINDLMEHGTQALAHVPEASRAGLVESLGEKLLQVNEFIEQLQLLRPALEAICKSEDTHALIAAVNSEVAVIANAEHCFYWVFDRTNDEVWTQRNGQEVKFRSDLGLVGTAIASGSYINVTDSRLAKSNVMEFGLQLQSALVYPVMDAERVTVGAVEIINNFAGKFDADEEYLVETILPAIAQTTVRTLSASTAVRLTRMKEELLRSVPVLTQCESHQALVEHAERLGTKLLGVDKCRLMLVAGLDLVSFGPKGKSLVSRDMGICGDVSRKLAPEIVGDPYNDIRYNSIVDVASSLPVYFVPVLGQTEGETEVVAVLQLPHKSAVKARVNDRSIRVDGEVAAVIDSFVSILSACLQRLL